MQWQYQRPFAAASAHGARLTIYNDEPVDSNEYIGGSLQFHRSPGNGLVVASGPNPDNDTYTISFRPGAGTWTALGVHVIQDETLPGNRLARGSDRFILTEVEARISPDGKRPAIKSSVRPRDDGRIRRTGRTSAHGGDRWQPEDGLGRRRIGRKKSVPGSAVCASDQDRARDRGDGVLCGRTRMCAAPPSDGFAWRCRPENTPGRKSATARWTRPRRTTPRSFPRKGLRDGMPARRSEGAPNQLRQSAQRNRHRLCVNTSNGLSRSCSPP